MTHYLKDYSRFATIAEMDAAAEQHVIQHWDELTKSDRHVLDIIRRYSVKYGDETYFKDIFMLFDKPVEGFYCP